LDGRALLSLSFPNLFSIAKYVDELISVVQISTERHNVGCLRISIEDYII